MTIERTHKQFQKNYLKKNNHFKILDLGCTNTNYWEEANHFADIAIESLTIFNDNEYKEALIKLIDTSIKRLA